MVEAYYEIGMIDDSLKTVKLGYNYPESKVV